MTSHKGESRTPQATVYKGDKVEIHDKPVADEMKASEGWFDNPADAKAEAAKKPAAKKAAKKPAA